MHYHHVEDSNGELTDIIPFCCDNCHQQWCEDNKQEYKGWNGCQEGSDSQEFCASCGVYCGGGTGEDAPCDSQTDNVVVNRFPSEHGIRCECGEHWLQVPIRFVEHYKMS